MLGKANGSLEAAFMGKIAELKKDRAIKEANKLDLSMEIADLQRGFEVLQTFFTPEEHSRVRKALMAFHFDTDY